MMFDDISIEPISHIHKVDRPNEPVHCFGTYSLRNDFTGFANAAFTL